MLTGEPRSEWKNHWVYGVGFGGSGWLRGSVGVGIGKAVYGVMQAVYGFTQALNPKPQTLSPRP